MVSFDFSQVHGFLAGALGGVMRPLAAFTCDVVPQTQATDKRGHQQTVEARPRNLERLPCQILDTTGKEIFIAGKRQFITGTIITFAAQYEGQPIIVKQSDRLRVHASGLVPERTYEIEHVGDSDGVQIVLVVKRVGG